jgi:hypothetical protein
MNAKQYKQVKSICMYQKLRSIAKQSGTSEAPIPTEQDPCKYEKEKNMISGLPQFVV